ncbi:MAG: hypothetical protein ACLS6G_13195 [Christensenellales bacterium]
MLLVIALYLFLNVNCVYLVVIGAVCGLLIAEFWSGRERRNMMVLLELFISFLKIGFTSFGLSMIPLITSK